jgi:hypothetical protein
MFAPFAVMTAVTTLITLAAQTSKQILQEIVDGEVMAMTSCTTAGGAEW